MPHRDLAGHCFIKSRHITHHDPVELAIQRRFQEFTVLDALKKRAAKAALPAKKSALLRAGIKALAAMNDAAFAAALGSLPATRRAAAKGKKA